MPSIAQLLPFLAKGWEEKCLEMGVIQRQRGIKTPQDLMLLSLFHLINGCSLLEISEVGRLLKIGEFSDVAFMKRFEKCKDWFAWICSQFSGKIVANYEKPTFLENYRPLAFDASEVVEKGRSGRRYRLHYGIDIFNLRTETYKITDVETGEKLRNFPLNKGDLAICDRAYSTRGSLEYCKETGADYLLRWRSNSPKVYDEKGSEVDIASKFSELTEEKCGEFFGFVHSQNGEMLPVRLCAKRKSDEVYKETLRKLRNNATRHMCKLKDKTCDFNRYIIIATSIGAEVSPEEILETYRYRWQVELYFKRMKSIMNFGDLPKKRIDSCFAWINGKMMVALMIEFFLSTIAFSTSDKERQSQHMA